MKTPLIAVNDIGDIFFLDEQGNELYAPRGSFEPENLEAFEAIVHACNSHDALVVALEQARKQIAALSKIDESGIGHDDAQSLVAHHVHEIQVLCDAFGYDPCEWLQEDAAKAAP